MSCVCKERTRVRYVYASCKIFVISIVYSSILFREGICRHAPRLILTPQDLSTNESESTRMAARRKKRARSLPHPKVACTLRLDGDRTQVSAEHLSESPSGRQARIAAVYPEVAWHELDLGHPILAWSGIAGRKWV